jgi:hypothetical protein
MSEEARKNLIALGIVGVVLVVLTGLRCGPRYQSACIADRSPSQSRT